MQNEGDAPRDDDDDDAKDVVDDDAEEDAEENGDEDEEEAEEEEEAVVRIPVRFRIRTTTFANLWLRFLGPSPQAKKGRCELFLRRRGRC